MIRTGARVCFWIGLAAVVLVTLSPIQWRPDTGLPPQFERFGAYLIAGELASAGYPDQRRQWALALVLSAAALEVLQALVPGRDARLLDFFAKGAGALLGVAIMAAAHRLWGVNRADRGT